MVLWVHLGWWSSKMGSWVGYLVILIFEIAIGSDHWCDNSPTRCFFKVFGEEMVIFSMVHFRIALFKKIGRFMFAPFTRQFGQDPQLPWKPRSVDCCIEACFPFQVWSFLLQEPRVTWPQTAANVHTDTIFCFFPMAAWNLPVNHQKMNRWMVRCD